MMSKEKGKSNSVDSDTTPKTGHGPKYQPPAPGCPNWQVYQGKVLYWCNVCNAWSTTHFTKTTEGVNVPGYLTNATVNGHQRGAGKCAQASASPASPPPASPAETTNTSNGYSPRVTIASVP
eukprot:12511760-Ditylum_brightwellii.AAC.1